MAEGFTIVTLVAGHMQQTSIAFYKVLVKYFEQYNKFCSNYGYEGQISQKDALNICNHGRTVGPDRKQWEIINNFCNNRARDVIQGLNERSFAGEFITYKCFCFSLSFEVIIKGQVRSIFAIVRFGSTVYFKESLRLAEYAEEVISHYH